MLTAWVPCGASPRTCARRSSFKPSSGGRVRAAHAPLRRAREPRCRAVVRRARRGCGRAQRAYPPLCAAPLAPGAVVYAMSTFSARELMYSAVERLQGVHAAKLAHGMHRALRRWRRRAADARRTKQLTKAMQQLMFEARCAQPAARARASMRTAGSDNCTGITAMVITTWQQLTLCCHARRAAPRRAARLPQPRILRRRDLARTRARRLPRLARSRALARAGERGDCAARRAAWAIRRADGRRRACGAGGCRTARRAPPAWRNGCRAARDQR